MPLENFLEICGWFSAGVKLRGLQRRTGRALGTGQVGRRGGVGLSCDQTLYTYRRLMPQSLVWEPFREHGRHKYVVQTGKLIGAPKGIDPATADRGSSSLWPFGRPRSCGEE